MNLCVCRQSPLEEGVSTLGREEEELAEQLSKAGEEPPWEVLGEGRGVGRCEPRRSEEGVSCGGDTKPSAVSSVMAGDRGPGIASEARLPGPQGALSHRAASSEEV